MGLLSLGILISTVAKSQMQAMVMSTFIFMPSMLLSGFVFPIAAMPDAFRYLSQVIPMTHFLQVVRGIMLKGIGFADLWWPTLAPVGVYGGPRCHWRYRGFGVPCSKGAVKRATKKRPAVAYFIAGRSSRI